MEPRTKDCLQPGLSILVGSVDPQGVPSCCRGIAIASPDDLETLTVYVPVATSQDTIRNVALTGRLAVVSSHPITHCSTQIKGRTIEARLAREDEAVIVRDGLEGFADILNQIGVPRRRTTAAAHWPAFAITMRVEQMFEQTPGPQAGTRLR